MPWCTEGGIGGPSVLRLIDFHRQGMANMNPFSVISCHVYLNLKTCKIGGGNKAASKSLFVSHVLPVTVDVDKNFLLDVLQVLVERGDKVSSDIIVDPPFVTLKITWCCTWPHFDGTQNVFQTLENSSLGAAAMGVMGGWSPASLP